MVRTLLAVVAALILVVAVGRWLQGRGARRQLSAAAATALREEVLSRRILAAGAPGAEGAVRGAIMDWNLGTGLATLVALDDGTVSLYLYLNPGGGTIGAGAHPAVARAATEFRKEAIGARGQFTETAAFRVPGVDSVAFYLLTDLATLSSGAISVEQIQRADHPLAAAGAAAQTLLVEVRGAR